MVKIFWKKAVLIAIVAVIFSGPGITGSRPPAVKGPVSVLQDHPLGHPAQGLLIWENDEEFQKIRRDCQASVRIAAFQTTLPDPLPGEEYNSRHRMVIIHP